MSITRKLIIYFLILVIFNLSISFYLIMSFSINKKEMIAQNSTVIANEVLKRINSNFRVIIEDIFLYSLHDYFNQFFKGTKIKNNDEKIADSLYISKKLKEQFFKFRGTNKGYQLFKNIYIIDLNGTIISSTDESLINKKINFDKFLNVLEEKEYYISEIFFDEKNNDYLKSLSILLKKDNGENKGIIQADISILSFIKDVEVDFELFDLSQLIIINNNNKLLIFKSGSYNILDNISKEKYFNSLKDDNGYFIIKENNQKFIYSYAKKNEQYKWMPDWSVIIKNSEKEILSSLNNLLFQIYFVIFLLIIILSVTIIIIARSILSSVKNLQQGAKIIGSGNLDYKIKSIAKDELNEVVLSFNDMVNNLNNALTKKDELEKKVEERTHELMLSNKELEAFSYSVSHDLKAPLRAIDGFSNMLLEQSSEQLDSESKRYLDVIRNNTQNMGILIDDLLSFSRIARQEIQLLKINMNSLANKIFNEIKSINTDRKIEFIINPMPQACGDLSMIKIVLTNLLSNAIKYTGTRTIAEIEIGGAIEKNETVYFIKDNGVGFDMKYIDKLFNVFQRLHKQEEFQGTGIGLALVQRIIFRHKGRVWAEGKVDEGATFHFTLPIKGEQNEL